MSCGRRNRLAQRRVIALATALVSWLSVTATLGAQSAEGRTQNVEGRAQESAEGRAQAPSQTLPERLTDAEFWKLITDVSEPGGTFRSDNFLSNERQYQWVLSDLQRITRRGGVYLGVGPEQNFTYIVAMEPKIAIIFDIRRQNMLEHLMYKALFEMSANRSQFMSRLFCRPLVTRFDSTTSIDTLTRAYREAAADTVYGARTLADIKATLAKHGFALTPGDLTSLDYVYNAFCNVGLTLDYNYGTATTAYGNFGGRGGMGMPNYADLTVATDENGVQRGYLASEANYRYLKSFQERNLLVPVVGDFAGPHAIRAVGDYLRAHNASVTAFYASNVEQYLFMQADDWRKYYENVASLPLDSASQFIRSRGGRYRNAGGRASVLASITELVRLFRDGKIFDYATVMDLAR
jgi:hypothetical protein